MRNLLALVAAVCLVPVALAEQDFAASEEMCPDVAMDLVIEAKKSVDLASLDAVANALDESAYDLIVDVREPSEYATGHLPGAINIPRGLIEFMIWKSLGFPEGEEIAKSLETSIFVYCNSGGRASLSGRSLGELGFSNVTVADMKLADWVAVGHPLEKGD